MAFGCDLLATPPAETWAVNYNGLYQYVKGDYMVQFDGNNLRAAYKFKSDPLLKENLLNTTAPTDTIADMEQELQALIQQYMQRMNGNQLTVK